MIKKTKVSVTRRIDLSNRELLSAYGRKLAKGEAVKVGVEAQFLKRP
jgi:hypothetical protein